MRGRAGRPRGVPCRDLLKRGIRRAGNQSNLARVIGVTRQAVSSWMKRITRPSKRLHRKIVGFVSAKR